MKTILMNIDFVGLLKIAASIRTPIGLAGLVCLCFFGLLWIILKKVPTLNQKGGIKILLVIIEYGFWLAVIACVLGLIGYIFFLGTKSTKSPALVDLDLYSGNIPITNGALIDLRGSRKITLRFKNRPTSGLVSAPPHSKIMVPLDVDVTNVIAPGWSPSAPGIIEN